MKVFCFSFVVYILLLLTQPCRDTFASVDTQGHGRNAAARVDNSPPADPASDECSPFCICSCCSHPVAAFSLTFGITEEPVNAMIAKAIADYKDPYTKTYHDSIWQPPKA